MRTERRLTKQEREAVKPLPIKGDDGFVFVNGEIYEALHHDLDAADSEIASLKEKVESAKQYFGRIYRTGTCEYAAGEARRALDVLEGVAEAPTPKPKRVTIHTLGEEEQHELVDMVETALKAYDPAKVMAELDEFFNAPDGEEEQHG